MLRRACARAATRVAALVAPSRAIGAPLASTRARFPSPPQLVASANHRLASARAAAPRPSSAGIARDRRSARSNAVERATYATSARAVDAAHRTANATRAAKREARRRTGAVAIKTGMTCDWDARGTRIPLTVLWIDDCEVVAAKTSSGADGYDAVQVGYGSRKPKQVTKAELGYFVRRKTNIKRALCEFRTSADGVLAPGTAITAAHFAAGQYVDVQGVTKGKGFQGPMKRWGFSGQPASHGNTKKHRAHGSIGQCQDPGRVFKGKKMAGRMGGRTRTVQSAYVYKVDTEKNLVYVKGQVPGNAGMAVKIRDSLRKPPALDGSEVPFPTAVAGEHATGVFVAPPQGADPFGNPEPVKQRA